MKIRDWKRGYTGLGSSSLSSRYAQSQADSEEEQWPGTLKAGTDSARARPGFNPAPRRFRLRQ
jgi:hypothetical protein